MSNKPFVFIVDSFSNYKLNEGLQALGLTCEDGYHTTGAGGADMILDVPRWLNSKNLLVFMSSFHGSVEPAVELSKKIKAANPNARIIFRSSTEHSPDSVFERAMKKDHRYDETLKIVAEFLAEK